MTSDPAMDACRTDYRPGPIARPLNWYGSKQKMCPVIHDLLPAGPNTFVDLFCGSGIVLLAKPRHPREVLNDRDGEVINLFQVLQDATLAHELYRRVELTPYAQDLLRRAYDADPEEDSVGRALHLLIRSWFGRGGDAYQTGFRWSKSQTVSPEMLWARLPDRLQRVAERLRGVCIRNDDALKIVHDYDHPDCILFVDPPYPREGRRYRMPMTHTEHAALAEALRDIRASVVLTMNPGTVYHDVLVDAGWHVTEVPVLGGGNATKVENIMTNFDPLPLFRTTQGRSGPEGTAA